MPLKDDSLAGGQASYDYGVDHEMTDHLLGFSRSLIDQAKTLAPVSGPMTTDTLSMVPNGISDWAASGGGVIDGNRYFIQPDRAFEAPPPQNPNVIQSDRYVPALAGHQTILQTPEQDETLKNVMKNVAPGKLDDSTQFRIDANGNVATIPVRIVNQPSINEDSKEEHWRIPIDGAPLGHAHSIEIIPGPKDDAAVIAGHPNNITYDGNVIVLEQDDGRYQARVLVDRTLTPSDRRNIQNALNMYQKKLQADALRNVPPP